MIESRGKQGLGNSHNQQGETATQSPIPNIYHAAAVCLVESSFPTNLYGIENLEEG